MKKIMTQRKLIYGIAAFAVIVGAWSYVLSEIYKYEMDAHYTMAPRRADEVDSKDFLNHTTHIEVPEEEELNSELFVAHSAF